MSRHIDDCNLTGNRLINMILISNFGQLADLRIQKRVFQTKVPSSLHSGSEVRGFAKGAELEVVRLRCFKRILGLKNLFSSGVLKRDLGLFTLRSARLVRMVKFWEKLLGYLEFGFLRQLIWRVWRTVDVIRGQIRSRKYFTFVVFRRCGRKSVEPYDQEILRMVSP